MTETTRDAGTADAAPARPPAPGRPTGPSAAPAPPEPARPAHRPGLLLTIVLLGQFMAILDVSIVNVAAPSIQADLGASGAALQLIVAGYTIAYAVLLITGARLGDLAGHRRTFLLGLAVFTAASLAGGVAGSTGVLVAFRCLQGVGAALMVPQVLSLIQRGFSGAARGRALGVYAAVIAGGAVVGQVVGGLLVSADLWGSGWRPVFLVNVPIGLVLLVAGHRVLPADHGERGRGLDLPGLVTLSPAVLLLVVPLVFGHEENWPLWGWLSMGLGAAAFTAFVFVERAGASRGRHPLIPGRVLRAPGVIAAVGGIFGGMATYGAFLFTLTLHLQSGLGYGALRSGLTFVPAAAGFATASLNWRRLPAGWHRPQIVVGYLAAAVGFAVQGLVMADGGTGGMALAAVLAVSGLGMGFAFSPLLTVALARVPIADAADASGLLATVTQLGQVVGVATLGTLYLTVAARPAAHPSAHALAVTAGWMAVVVLAAAACSTPFLRRQR